MSKVEKPNSKDTQIEPPASGDLRKAEISVEYWKDMAKLSEPGSSSSGAEDAVTKQFGQPTIVGTDGKIYLQGYVSEDQKRDADTVGKTPYKMKITEGVKSLDDLKALGFGIGEGLVTSLRGTVDALSKPGVINESLMNAGNYYATTPSDQVVRDAKVGLGALGQVIKDTLGHPLTPEETGNYAGMNMPFFLPIGVNKVLKGPELEAMGGAQKFEQMSAAELQANGLQRFEMPMLKFGNDGYSMRTTIPGDDRALVMAKAPSPGVVEVTYYFKGSLPEGAGNTFLSQSLKGHGLKPTKQLLFTGIRNEETLDAFNNGVPAADSLLGRSGAKALRQLGIEPKSYRFEMVRGKLNLYIDTQ